jgi:hypothetical protein
VKELDSYLNDHLAGSVGALELIAHCAHLYEGKSLGLFFAEMEAQIGADQATLRDLMSSPWRRGKQGPSGGRVGWRKAWSRIIHTGRQ